MAEAYTLSQEQSYVLEKAISSIAEEHGGKSLSSEDLGIIKHIISPEDICIQRRNFSMLRKEVGPFSSLEYEALMKVIQNIFHHALFRVKSASQENFRESNEKIDGSLRSTEELDEIDDNIQRTVSELQWEMISRCACGEDDAHEVTLALLDSLCGYNCVAQVVLVVAAFAMSFGEFWLTVEPLASDPLAQSVCLLKRPHCLLEVTDSLKSGLESVRTLVKRVWDLTYWFVNYEEILTLYPYTFPEVLLIGYQVVYSVVTCFSHNIALMRMNKMYTTLAFELQQMRSSSERLAYLHSYVCARREVYCATDCVTDCATASIFSIFIKPSYPDVSKFISRLICRTGKLVLRHPSTKGKVTLEQLTGKCIALFISDFKLQKEEFPTLLKTYKALKNPKTCFEVVWVPMVDQCATWTEENKRMVSSTGASMPWYWVCDPSTINSSFVQRVKEEWHFQGKPILVILDRRTGKIEHTNALSMIELWGPSAYPFSIDNEERLQEGLSCAFDIMFSTNEPNMNKWVEEGKIICFYGSHNKDWIRRFLQKMEFITRQTNFEMEITYIGTNKKRELPSILTMMKDTDKSRVWSEERILSFWHTLKKLKCSKNKCFSMRKEFINILSYDEHQDGWAIIFEHSKQEVVKSFGTKLIECLDCFTTYISRIQEPKDFLRELNEDLQVKHAAEHCSAIMIPTNDGSGQIHCMECGRFICLCIN